MALALAHITFDCADPVGVAGFWSATLEVPVDEGATEFFASIGRQATDGPSWFFIRVPEPRAAKTRVHVDLAADDREGEVGRLVGLGATRVSDHDEWGTVWTVLQDPEGHEFCVAQGPSQGVH